MVENDRFDHMYSVGGRIKFGETAEESVVREVFEETGMKMEIDRLGFIHENFFQGDSLKKREIQSNTFLSSKNPPAIITTETRTITAITT